MHETDDPIQLRLNKMKKVIRNILIGLAILFVIAVLFTIITDFLAIGNVSKAKTHLSKKQFGDVATYITDEIKGCSQGETIVMGGNLTCGDRTAASVIAATVITTKGDQVNPYETTYSSVTSGGTNTSDSDAGYIRLSVSGENIIIKTCHKKPCLTKNQSSETIALQ